MKYLPITIFLTVFFISCSLIENPQIAPPFKIDLYETVDYKENTVFDLSSQSGKPTIINFWFPSCPPCTREIPEINQFHEEYKDSVTVVGIKLIGIDTIESGRDFMKSKNVSYRVGPDNDGSITVDYSISGFPTTIFIDKLGRIHEKWEGEIKKSDIVDIAQEIFEK